MLREEHGGGAGKLALFATVHSQARVNETGCAAETNFDEYEAVNIEHDEVDFAASGPEVSDHRAQSALDQVVES